MTARLAIAASVPSKSHGLRKSTGGVGNAAQTSQQAFFKVHLRIYFYSYYAVKLAIIKVRRDYRRRRFVIVSKTRHWMGGY